MKTSGIAALSADDGVVRSVHWGDTVRIHFLLWLDDGTMLDSSLLGGPLTFTAGENIVMQGMEELVIGMAVGESKTEKMSTNRVFGQGSADASSPVTSRQLQPRQVTQAVRRALGGREDGGMRLRMAATGIDGTRATGEGNHRFAEPTLILQLELLDILAPVTLSHTVKPDRLGALRT